MLQRTNHHLLLYQACIDIDSLVIPILIPIPTNLPVLSYFSRSVPSNTFHLIYLSSMVYMYMHMFSGYIRRPSSDAYKTVQQER